MFKKGLTMILCIFLSLVVTSNSTLFVVPTSAETAYIDNSDLMPKYVTDDKVTLIDGAPDWVNSMVMLQCRISYATKEGTLRSAVKVFPFFRVISWQHPSWVLMKSIF